MDDGLEEAFGPHAELGSDGEEAAAFQPDRLDVVALIRTSEAVGAVPRPSLSSRAARRIEANLVERARRLRLEMPLCPPRREPIHAAAVLGDGMAALNRGRGRRGQSLRRRLGLVATLLAALVVLGGGTVLAATDTLPSHLFYPVKIAGERAQLIMAQSSAARARARMLAAEHRLGEIEAITGSGEQADEWLLGELQDEINATLKEIEKIATRDVVDLLSKLNGIISRQEGMLQAILLVAPAEAKADIEIAVEAARERRAISDEALARALLRGPNLPASAAPRVVPVPSPDPTPLDRMTPVSVVHEIDNVSFFPAVRAVSSPSEQLDDAVQLGKVRAERPKEEQQAKEPERGKAGEEEDEEAHDSNEAGEAKEANEAKENEEADDDEEAEEAMKAASATATPTAGARLSKLAATPTPTPTTLHRKEDGHREVVIEREDDELDD